MILMGTILKNYYAIIYSLSSVALKNILIEKRNTEVENRLNTD